MLPVLALVGRPNVGKSTLFNRLTRSRDAIVNDQSGVTRDRLYGQGRIGEKAFLAVDTGGLEIAVDAFGKLIRAQVELAIEEAQAVLFIVDLRAGLVPQDRNISLQLRQSGVKVFVVVNKSEGVETELAASEFQEMGMGTPLVISAKTGEGVQQLVDTVLDGYALPAPVEDSNIPIIALAGRPNVGKSTLTNQLAGTSRVLVSEVPGTTRDKVRVPLCINGEQLILIDTAGVRRKSRVDETIEKFSSIKALQAMADAHVVILMIDARTEVSTQDSTLAGMIMDMGRSMVVVVNKCEKLGKHWRTQIKEQLIRKLSFLPNTEILFISALSGNSLTSVIPAALRAYRSAMISIPTSDVNKVLAQAVARTPPPMQNQRVVRLKFAHQAGKNPPVIVVHGNRIAQLPTNYRRYLVNYFTRAYRLNGTSVRLILRSADNPYKSRKSTKSRAN